MSNLEIIKSIEPGPGDKAIPQEGADRDAQVAYIGNPPPADSLTQVVIDVAKEAGLTGGTVIETTVTPTH